MISQGSAHLTSTLKTQVCIVGSGQAGITLAWYLLDHGVDVLLLEGSRSTVPGGPNAPVPPNPYHPSQSGSPFYNENVLLYNGTSDGLFAQNEPEFLIRPTPTLTSGAWERDRIYGGTSTHWGGQSRPLDPVTFEARDGFPGWPITREDLDPAYAEACAFLDLFGPYYGPGGEAGYNFTAEFWARQLGLQVAELDGFFVAMYQFVPQQNLQFQSRRRNGLTIGESRAHVVLNASLLEIGAQGGSVGALTVGVMTDDATDPGLAGTFTVEADAYVLACGAVANARQLLLSDVGNESDCVGRYLMGHPIASGARAVSANGSSYLTTPEQTLLSYFNPNTMRHPTWPSQYPISLLAGLFTPTADAARTLTTGRCWFGPNGSDNFYHGLLPERESRITLADTRDPVFGQPQTRATWVLSPDAERNYDALTGLFADGVEAAGGDAVDVAEWSEVEPHMVFNGHHLGTTRMSADPADGVVDANLKVHTVDNLYVAGSSVWASAGISNPTFSIVAFSIRLAEHLAGELGASGAA